MRVAIILCTYNGSAFLRAQLDSLVNQLFTDWTCYIFDDCSTDETQPILLEYARRYPQHFAVSVNPECSGSAAANFIAATNSAYFTQDFDLLCYCDQDDIWSERKLTILVDTFEKADRSLPLLVFSDLSIVDERLNILHASFVDGLSVGGYFKHFQHRFIMVNNIVPGCSLMCNRALVERALPFSKHTRFHDWWMVLVALKTGSIVYVPEKLVLYRQHATNSVGIPPTTTLAKLARTRDAMSNFGGVYQMIKELYPDERMSSLLPKYIYAKSYKCLHYR